jgi:hypothetical protein
MSAMGGKRRLIASLNFVCPPPVDVRIRPEQHAKPDEDSEVDRLINASEYRIAGKHAKFSEVEDWPFDQRVILRRVRVPNHRFGWPNHFVLIRWKAGIGRL